MNRILLKYLLLFFLPATLVLCGVALLYHNLESERQRANRALIERERVNAGVVLVRDAFKELIRDLRVLSLSNQDALVAREGSAPHPHIIDEWLAFVQAKQVYDQIRWLDPSGKEQLRINLTSDGPVVVPQTDLQDKGQRYYFQASIQLHAGEIYISPLDLNVEKGRIELPYKPTIRLGTPLFDGEHRPRGVIFLNYRADEMLQAFSRATRVNDRSAWLVNRDGYWLKSDNSDDEWGFMFGREDLSVAKRYPEAWSRIRSTEQGQFENAAGLWTVATVRFLRNGEPGGAKGSEPAAAGQYSLAQADYIWKVVSLLPASAYHAGGQRHAAVIAASAALLISLSFVICWLSAKARYCDLQFNRGLQQLVKVRTEELQQRSDELAQRNIELERFLYTASHDLKTPLVTLNIFLDMFELHLEKNDIKQIQEDMHYMQNAAHKMKDMLENVLALSRVGRVVAPAEKVAYRELVDEALKLTAGPIVERGVRVRADETSLILYGDRSRLLEIWQNLVENAAKYMGPQEEPEIEIGVDQTGEGPVFYVSDNGLGIEPGHQEKVFGLFEKLDPQSEGTGIGLAMVKRIVELYRGRIWVESAGVGCGSCFRFTLPGALTDPKESV